MTDWFAPGLALGIALLLSGCLEPADLSYYLNFEARDSQRSVVARAFGIWGEATGTAPYETDDRGTARIVISEGESRPGEIGHADYRPVDYYDLESMRTVTFLDSGTVVVDPDLWWYEPDQQLKFFIHEIGHIMTAQGNLLDCPSTLNGEFYRCGSKEIDPATRNRAIRMIDNGWLLRPVDYHL